MFIVIFWILLYSTPVIIAPGTSEIELKIRDMEFYEDNGRILVFSDVSAPAFQSRFNKDLNFTPADYNTSSAYWMKLKIHLPEIGDGYLIEFFDQSIDSLDVYLKHESEQEFRVYHLGDLRQFSDKVFRHKNFQVPLSKEGNYSLYYRVYSHEYADIRLAIRSYDFFVGYAIIEYFLYGIFYGMILIISLYNLLIYSAIREVKYLYYTFYILSVGVFAMSVDGIAYQYLWPNSPYWNQMAHGISLFLVIFWAILFSKKFLGLVVRAPKINRILNTILGLRILWFLYALIIDNQLFQYRNIELIPLTTIFIGSIIVYRRGYKPARFFIVAFGFLFVGFVLKALLMLSIIPFYIQSYYSLHICFVFEMAFLSFALSDRVRILKSNRDKALKRIIAQHEENARIKDRMNTRLESIVNDRTRELQEKNEMLSRQKLEISEINSLLDLDNWRLRNNIKSIQLERLQNKELSYDEFQEVFSEKEDCLKALSNFKWLAGFQCNRCENSQYGEGTSPYSRRCTRCGYQESPTTNTLFHGVKFPLEKAFYILYETLTKNQYSLAEMADILDIRKNTVWDFKKRIQAQSEAEKKALNKIFENLEDIPRTEQSKTQPSEL